MKYTLTLLIAGSFSLIFGVPHLHVYLTQNPVPVTNEVETLYDDSFEFTPPRRISTPSPETTFPELAGTQLHK